MSAGRRTPDDVVRAVWSEFDDDGGAGDNLVADLADDIHIGTTHPQSGVCHGDNDGCEGGPSELDCELADRALGHVRDFLRVALDEAARA